jgi:hypothetical protein
MPHKRTIPRECKQCGAPFFSSQYAIDRGSGKFCCHACYLASRNQPVARRCETCGASFVGIPSHIARGQDRFCSPACWYKHFGTIRGKDKWTWKGEDVICTCEQCGKEFPLRPGRVEWKPRSEKQTGKRRFCSRRCRALWAREAYRGENNPQWRGGSREVRVNDSNRAAYREWRMTVFRRDDYTCQHCGERGGKLNAHHIRPWKEAADLRFAPSNGITLCKPCHINVHRIHTKGTGEGKTIQMKLFV